MAQSLPIHGVGCWVLKTSVHNPFIYSDVFDWYAVDYDALDSFKIDKVNKPLFIAFYSKFNADFIIKEMEKYKGKITGVIWDFEIANTPQTVAEKDFKKIHARAKALNLKFGISTWPNPKNSLKTNGVSYRNAPSFADFLIPQLYAQRHKYSREKLLDLLSMERKETNIPIVCCLTIETIKTTPPQTLTPAQILGFYKNLPVSGYLVWNTKLLDTTYINALSQLK